MQVTEAVRSSTEAHDQSEFTDLLTLLGGVATTLGRYDSQRRAYSAAASRGRATPPA